jgi:hypothetical protein
MLLEHVETQLNNLVYEIKDEIRQQTEEVERKVMMTLAFLLCKKWLSSVQYC